MKKLTILLIGIFCIPSFLMAQDSTMSDYTMVELTYMKAKVGMEQDFQNAVHKHNEKYHPEGPYQSELWAIATGAEAGWYVWVMGPVTFTELDGSPGKGSHADDWRNNVSEYVSDYGRTEYWKMKPDFSTADAEPDHMFSSWLLEIEPGMYHDFKEFMDKVHVIHLKHPEDEIKVWSNVFGGSDGRDVALNFTLESWADFDQDDWGMKDEYNEEYGEGSWTRALEDWRSFVNSMDRSVWKLVPPKEK